MVCVCVCWTHWLVLQKWLSSLRCHLGCGLWGPKVLSWISPQYEALLVVILGDVQTCQVDIFNLSCYRIAVMRPLPMSLFKQLANLP